MAEVCVVNASPVIALAKVSQIDLLTRMADQVLLPAAVVEEILAGPATDPARKAIESGWGHRAEAVELPASILEWSLGAGESHALALAVRRGAMVVLDDAEARRCARTLKLRLLGTLGIVLRAQRMKWISDASTVLQQLRDAGLWLDDAMLQEALRRIERDRGR